MKKEEIKQKIEKVFGFGEEDEQEFINFLLKSKKRIVKIVKIVKIIEAGKRGEKRANAVEVIMKMKKEIYGAYIFYGERNYASYQFVYLEKGVDIKLEFSLSPYGGVNLYTRKEREGWELEKILL